MQHVVCSPCTRSMHKIQTQQRHLADDVQDAAVGDVGVAAVDEAVVDEGERLEELLLGGVRLRVVLQVLLHVHVRVHQAVVQHLPAQRSSNV